MNWRDRLAQLANTADDAEFPLIAFRVSQPVENATFPDLLPSSGGLRDFYAICDGGSIGDFQIVGIGEIEESNRHWRQNLSNYYPDGTSPLNEQHLVLGSDSAGAPLIWDSERDAMLTFWFKGGDWESLDATFETWIQDLLVPARPLEGDLWHEALALLDNNSEQDGGGQPATRPKSK